jgi:hypothetical protein
VDVIVSGRYIHHETNALWVDYAFRIAGRKSLKRFGVELLADMNPDA